jgi:ribonuclease P/MRP protein subunit RPP40
VLEKIVKRNILEHLLRNNLLTKVQHGFLPNRSCTTNMLVFMDSLTDARDHGQITDTIFFDFAKAFDKVPHRPLLQKLLSYGIDMNVLTWVKSFLTGRTFRVRVGDSLSSPSPVHSGVPQGSVLGPLLFLIYINDLPDMLTTNCLLYADDIKIWALNDPSTLQIDIDAVMRWSEEWNLPLNKNKCVHMSFGGDSGNLFVFNSENGPLSLNTVLKQKDLGIWLTSSLSFSLHHEEAAKKAFRVL